MRADAAAALVALLALTPAAALAQSATAQAPKSNSGNAKSGDSAKGKDGEASGGGEHEGAVGDFPKLSFDTLFNVELSGLSPRSGPGRGPTPYVRFDSTVLVDISDSLSVNGLFQYKARKPRPAEDPNGTSSPTRGPTGRPAAR